MSTQAVVNFFTQVERDQELGQALVNAVDFGLDAVIKLARDRGFPFTQNDLQTVVTDHLRTSQSGELSDDELGAIAGGTAVTAWGKYHFVKSLITL